MFCFCSVKGGSTAAVLRRGAVEERPRKLHRYRSQPAAAGIVRLPALMATE